jgi:hypothetical protein
MLTRIFSFVLLNRLPSLYKMNMMCHRVKIMPYSSECTCFEASLPPLRLLFLLAFRLNPSVYVGLGQVAALL